MSNNIEFLLERLNGQFNKVCDKYKDIRDLVIRQEKLPKYNYGSFIIGSNQIYLSENYLSENYLEPFWLTVVLHEAAHALQFRKKLMYRKGKPITKVHINSYHKRGVHYYMLEQQADTWAAIIYDKLFVKDYTDKKGHLKWFEMHASHLRRTAINYRKRV